MAVEITLISSLRQSIEKSPTRKAATIISTESTFNSGETTVRNWRKRPATCLKLGFRTKGLEETRLCLLFYLRCQGNFLAKNPIVKMWLNTSRTQHIPEAVSTSNAVCAVARGLETWARRTINWASFCCLVTK